MLIDSKTNAALPAWKKSAAFFATVDVSVSYQRPYNIVFSGRDKAAKIAINEACVFSAHPSRGRDEKPLIL